MSQTPNKKPRFDAKEFATKAQVLGDMLLSFGSYLSELDSTDSKPTSSQITNNTSFHRFDSSNESPPTGVNLSHPSHRFDSSNESPPTGVNLSHRSHCFDSSNESPPTGVNPSYCPHYIDLSNDSNPSLHAHFRHVSKQPSPPVDGSTSIHDLHFDHLSNKKTPKLLRTDKSGGFEPKYVSPYQTSAHPHDGKGFYPGCNDQLHSSVLYPSRLSNASLARQSGVFGCSQAYPGVFDASKKSKVCHNNASLGYPSNREQEPKYSHERFDYSDQTRPNFETGQKIGNFMCSTNDIVEKEKGNKNVPPRCFDLTIEESALQKSALSNIPPAPIPNVTPASKPSARSIQASSLQGIELETIPTLLEGLTTIYQNLNKASLSVEAKTSKMGPADETNSTKSNDVVIGSTCKSSCHPSKNVSKIPPGFTKESLFDAILAANRICKRQRLSNVENSVTLPTESQATVDGVPIVLARKISGQMDHVTPPATLIPNEIETGPTNSSTVGLAERPSGYQTRLSTSTSSTAVAATTQDMSEIDVVDGTSVANLELFPGEYPPVEYPTVAAFTSNVNTDSPKYRHLFQEDMRNVVFIYKELDNGYKLNNGGGRLDKAGRYAQERMGHILRYHVIFSNPRPLKGNVCFVKTAEECHYQDLFSCFHHSVSRYGLKIPVHLYDPSRDHNNNFVLINNSCGHEFVRDLTSLDHQSLLQFGPMANTFESGVDKNTTRQRKYVDLGWTTTQCSTRTNSCNGVSKPSLKPGWDHAVAKSCFKALSSAAKRHRPRFLEEGSPFVDHENPTRHRDFAEKICEGNIVSYARVNYTHLGNGKAIKESLCGPHNDRLSNARPPTLAMNVNISWLFYDKNNKNTLTRINIGGTDRHSICRYYANSKISDPLTRYLASVYDGVDDQRKTFGPHLLSGPRHDSILPGVHIISNPCHMQASSFQSGFIHPILLMAQRFKLSLPEVISLERCILCMPNTSFFFAFSCYLFENFMSFGSLPPHLQGFRLGFAIQRLMRSLNSGREKTNGIWRFPVYSEPRWQAKYVEWERECTFILSLSLSTYAVFPKARANESTKRAHQQVMDRFVERFNGAGVLTINHFMAIKSYIGTLPSWVRTIAQIEMDGKYMQFYRERFPRVDFKTATGFARVLRHVQSSFEERFERKYFMNEIENIFCKVYRIDNGVGSTDNTFADVIFPYQDMFEFQDGNRIAVVNNRGYLGQRGDTVSLFESLIERFAFGGSQLKMPDLVKTMRIPSPTNIPTVTELSQFTVEGQMTHVQRSPVISYSVSQSHVTRKAEGRYNHLVRVLT